MRHGFLQKLLRFKVTQHRLACFKAIKSLIRLGTVFVNFRVQRKDRDQRQVVTQCAGVVVEIMGASDLDATGAKGAIYEVVGNDRNFSITQRQVNKLADQMLVALVLRVNGQRTVGEHRLRTRGGDVHADDQIAFVVKLWAVGKRIQDVPHEPVALDRFHLKFRHRRLQHWVPIHKPLTAIN